MITSIRNFILTNLKFYIFVLCITLLYGITFTLFDFIDNPFRDFKDFTIIAMQYMVILFSIFGLIYLLAINKIIFSILFPPLTAILTVITFFKSTAKISLTSMVLDATLTNDLKTSLDLVSISLILFVLASISVSIILVFIRFKHIKRVALVQHILISLLVISSTNYLFTSPISARTPYILFYTLRNYLQEKNTALTVRRSISENATTSIDSLNVIFVIGESLRPDHLEINGYKRNTTPHIKELDVYSLPNIYSEYTYTNRSIPHILTRADSLSPNLAFEEPSFISIFNACNFNTAWIANQESADSYIYFIKECKNVYYPNIGKSVYSFDKWLDEDLIPDFEKELIKPSPKKLIILHTIGSHWWYNAHYPESFKKFEPIVKSRVLSSCSNEEMLNSYDNTVLYTDFFLSKLIERLKSSNSILIYLSDHGESLGENGIWLHASSQQPCHSTASFVWASESYKRKNPNKINALKTNILNHWRTDFLFHSIIDASDIKSPYLKNELSIFTNHNKGN